MVGDDQIRLNQIQLVGSHNSYHIAPEGTILIPLTLGGLAVPGLVEGLGNPLSLNYTHAPLPTQLQRGVRTFELDVYADPLGGRFSVPRLVELFNVQQPNIPPGLDQPGLKVSRFFRNMPWNRPILVLPFCSTIQFWASLPPTGLKPSFRP